MALRFTMLASGSRGNACLIQANGFGVLLDAGLGPRQLNERLLAAGQSWDAIQAMLLTHTHSDHWNDRTLGWLVRRQVPLYCHPGHHAVLSRYSTAFAGLNAAGLVRSFTPGEELCLAPGLRCHPLPVRHDSGATFGFRLEGEADLFGRAPPSGTWPTWAPGTTTWPSDWPTWTCWQWSSTTTCPWSTPASGLPPSSRTCWATRGISPTIRRPLLCGPSCRRSTLGRLRYLVQLHLSEDCNRPALARRAARVVLDELSQSTQLHTARQDGPGPAMDLEPANGKRRRSRGVTTPSPRGNGESPWLPGMEEEQE